MTDGDTSTGTQTYGTNLKTLKHVFIINIHIFSTSINLKFTLKSSTFAVPNNLPVKVDFMHLIKSVRAANVNKIYASIDSSIRQHRIQSIIFVFVALSLNLIIYDFLEEIRRENKRSEKKTICSHQIAFQTKIIKLNLYHSRR